MRFCRGLALLIITFVGSSCSVACSGKPQQKTPPADAAVASASAAASAFGVDVVSNASGSELVEAGPAPSIAADEVDGAALRAKHRAAIKADTSPVTILEGGTPRELGARLCEQVVPKRGPETPVLIKPNLGGFDWFKDPAKNNGDDGIRGRTTDVEFVRGIVQCLKKRGHKAITIAEGWDGSNANWIKITKVSGYDKMADEEHVKLVAMDDDGVFDKQGDRPAEPMRIAGMEKSNVPKLLMPRVLAKHLKDGLFISAPKIKAHRFGVVTMSIKGMQGTVMTSDGSPAMHQKKEMHREISSALSLLQKDREAGMKAYLASLEIFAERMTDVLEIEAPDVVLADGAPMESGDGFGKRWPSKESVAIGGTNPILVDRVGAQMLGLWDNADLAAQLGGHKTSPLIETAAKRFEVDLSEPAVNGNGAALLKTKRPVHFVSMAGWSLHSDDSPPEIAPGLGATPPPELHASNHGLDAATPVTFDTDWSGASSGISTTVRAAWTNEALSMRWNLSGAGLNVDDSKPTETEREKLYEEDCVELFFTPDAADPNHYYEIELGPKGHFFDLEVHRRAKVDVKNAIAWSSAPKIATKVDTDKHTATIDATFRAPDIVKALKAGASLPLALYRMEGKSPRKYLAWSPTRTPKPDFHVPSAFGRLVLDP
jgi:uncharacterized protein (DUF362 family)